MQGHFVARVSLAVGLALAACGEEPSRRIEGGTSEGVPTSTTAEATSGASSGVPPSETTSGAADESSGSIKLDVDAPDAGGGLSGAAIPSTCAQAEISHTTVGCEFFTVDLDQFDNGDDLQFAASVSNVQPSESAEVLLERRVGGVWEVVEGPVTVPSQGLHTFLIDDFHQEETGVAVGGAYRITSDIPIVAYQFNPLRLEPGVASSDATMLLPVAAWDHIHHGVGWEPATQFGHGSYLTIAAAVDGTLVEIVPSTTTLAGPGVPAAGPNMPLQIALDAGDIVEVMTKTAGADLSGTLITSDEEHPVAVFSGSECAQVLEPYCDHLETQLTGVRSWGTSFVAARVPPRVSTPPEPSVWQIYASEDDTRIEFEASVEVTGVPTEPLVLARGEISTLQVAGSAEHPGDFIVTSNKAIALVNYMVGSDLADGTGDPAMVQLPPVEQFLPRYVVLVPESWDEDFATLIRPTASVIELDGSPVDEGVFVSVGPNWEVGRLPIADGVHRLESSTSFGIVISGVTPVDSYAYVGGLGTEVINPDPPG